MRASIPHEILFKFNLSLRVDSTEIKYGLPVRTFKSFKEAAQEAAFSRLYGGIHFRPAIENGIEQGKKVGNHMIIRLNPNEKIALKQ
jgi:hypothetical protein